MLHDAVFNSPAYINKDDESKRKSVMNINKHLIKTASNGRVTHKVDMTAEEIQKLEHETDVYIATIPLFNPYDIQFLNRRLKGVHIEGKHLTTHIFRHTHISMLAELGVPLKTIMQRVGHNDPNTTLSIYTHVTKSMHDDVINKLNHRQA